MLQSNTEAQMGNRCWTVTNVELVPNCLWEVHHLDLICIVWRTGQAYLVQAKMLILHGYLVLGNAFDQTKLRNLE